MVRLRNLTLTDWTTANNALMQRFEGNKSKLSNHVAMSRTTITNFFSQKPVGESTFRKICLALGLHWQQVSSGDITSDSSNGQPGQLTDLPELDEALIRQIRERCRQKILERHSRMRLLSGEEIEVDKLYVDVWLLGKPEGKYFNTPESLLNSFDIEKDRLALSKRIQRNPGFEIANSKSKLVILGKPGSGKTTFLKHLAIDWCKEKFQAEKIAILIELRRVREQTWNLIDAISHELQLTEQEVFSLLEQGSLLILMDGLDEVNTNELRRNVQDQVKQVSEEYSDENRFILACRTQIIETIPIGFTSVEVADFSPEQVRQFVQNWFMANGQSEIEANKQWEKINYATINQPDLRELVVTPVLLSLMCLVLQDAREMPSDRSWLYSKGIKLLLSRWNNEKEIQDWEVGTEAYRQLSIKDKEALLVEIAARKFENPKNFVLFEQDEISQQISRKLQLPDVKEGVAVLEAIEAQHGLLIERADELWSFSHLTFQEYFTVQWLTQLSSQQLATKIASQQWQEVVEQLVKSQQPADRLLRLIKQAIDQAVAQETIIQTFLEWLLQRLGSIQTDYKSAAIRALYSLNFDLALAFALDLAIGLDIDHQLDHDLTKGFLTRNLDLDYNRARVRALALARNLDRDLEINHNPALALDLALNLGLVFSIDLDRARIHALVLERDLDYVLDFALSRSIGPDLFSALHRLKNELPKSNHSQEIQHWWSLCGVQWIEQFRQVMIEYRNIGHDWQFTKEQQRRLQQYYGANKFLADLIKIEGAVSEEYRAEIEDGLLLPWVELQRRYPHLYGELEG